MLGPYMQNISLSHTLCDAQEVRFMPQTGLASLAMAGFLVYYNLHHTGQRDAEANNGSEFLVQNHD